MLEEDRLGLLSKSEPERVRSWRDDPIYDEIPDSLDDLLADDALEVTLGFNTLRHVTPAAERHMPDHRAEFSTCRDLLVRFEALFEDMQRALDAGEREATLIEARAVIEPLEGDFFIRSGLLAYIAERVR